ncbi:response regulator transcription factor [Adlercreutzia sp. ZJ304]|uniref:response regulator transcription factor n=1 Tax=Adlercreutzia sp. ZJ304 TaxID=2709791 RepID=UPI0013ED0D1E|nr:response regulator transcription factor [Adlercreutzia sp. ZJ304]
MQVLLVEDDNAIVHALTDILSAEGLSTVSESTQSAALAQLESQHFDIALLDVTLAEGNGFAVCAAARKTAPSMPIIFLTASDDEYSTVAGLDMGAVDYISKPFRARELVSRIKAALRQANPAERILSAGDIQLDATSAQVMKAGQELFLSALEYRLLLYFLQHKTRLITRENLKDAIWDSAGEYVSDNAINVYIKRLREKIETDPTEPQIITTVRGMGYKVGK